MTTVYWRFIGWNVVLSGSLISYDLATYAKSKCDLLPENWSSLSESIINNFAIFVENSLQSSIVDD